MVRAAFLIVLVFAPSVLCAQHDPAAVATATPPVASAPGQAPTIRFGMSSFLPSEQLQREFRPLLDFLGTAVGRSVELVIEPSYADAIDATVRGRFDVAYLTPASYVIARQRRPDLKLLLTDVRSGLDFYSSVLVVRAEDQILSVKDLRGRRIAFVDRDSTSGYVYPIRYLASMGLTPSQFGEARFSGNHLRSLQMLLAHETDVAAVSSALLEGARDGGLDLSGVTILARTGTIPQHAVCSTGRLPADVEARLVEALLSVTSLTDEGRRLLPRGMRLNGYRRAEPEEYDDVEKTLRGDDL